MTARTDIASPLVGAPSTGRDALRRLRAPALAAALALPALVPLLSIAAALFVPEREIWAHLARHVLPEVVANSLVLVVGVAVVSGTLGTALAWLMAMCELPGRRFFDWALLLPLAMPTYVLAFVAVGLLDYAGPIQTWWRATFGSTPWFLQIRSTGGVIVVMSLALYPYVYLLARMAFLSQGRRALEAAQSLGVSRTAATWRIALPMARPWIAAGIALVSMETLADFGAVSVFNYDTFTTAIYRSWLGMFSVNAALQLAAVLLVFVLAVAVLERRARAGARFATARDVSRAAARMTLAPLPRALGTMFVVLVFGVATVVPLAQLLVWVLERAVSDLDARYIGFVARSLVLASGAALSIVAAGLALAYVARRQPTRTVRGLVRLATLGYAIPGTVLAIGLLVPAILAGNTLQALLRGWLGEAAPAIVLHGTVLTVLVAYWARFLAVGFGPLESGLLRVTPSLDEAAIGLGVRGVALFRRVHAPLLRTSALTAATLVFVDVMKEMPITLIMRPFGWDTLAVRVFEMTAEGEWERAALPAMAIVVVGLVPVALLTRRSSDVA
jgi:iron(III) transport system permease protein